MSIHFKNIERPVRIVLVLLIAVLINIVCSFIHFSFDLTEDKKFTLTQATKNTLHKISDAIYVRVLRIFYISFHPKMDI
jgi:ABC-2 type transport system permease protein